MIYTTRFLRIVFSQPDETHVVFMCNTNGVSMASASDSTCSSGVMVGVLPVPQFLHPLLNGRCCLSGREKHHKYNSQCFCTQ